MIKGELRPIVLKATLFNEENKEKLVVGGRRKQT